MSHIEHLEYSWKAHITSIITN